MIISSRFGYTLALLCLLADTQTACLHIPVTTPNGPGGDVVSEDATGFTVNQQGYDHLISEGAKPTQFLKTSDGYYVTNGQWHDINETRVK